MNRFTFLLLLLGTLSSTALAQPADTIKVNQDLKKKLIDRLGKSWMHEQIWFDSAEYYSFFRAAYLNNDTLVDFVYYGPSSGEPFMTTLYLNRGDELKEIMSGMGSIRQYEKPFPDSPTLMHFVEWGCCDDPHNIYQLWSLVNNKVTEGEKYHFLEKTTFPKNIKYSFSIRVQNTPYTLRATPKIINEEFHYHYDKGNIVAEYSEGDIGHVLSSSTDETGRVWYFVVMEEQSKVGYHNYSIFRDAKWMGWMSNRYVEVLNGR